MHEVTRTIAEEVIDLPLVAPKVMFAINADHVASYTPTRAGAYLAPLGSPSATEPSRRPGPRPCGLGPGSAGAGQVPGRRAGGSALGGLEHRAPEGATDPGGGVLEVVVTRERDRHHPPPERAVDVEQRAVGRTTRSRRCWPRR